MLWYIFKRSVLPRDQKTTTTKKLKKYLVSQMYLKYCNGHTFQTLKGMLCLERGVMLT